MRLPQPKTTIILFLFSIPILSLFIACAIKPSLAPIKEPKLEPTATSTKEKLKVHFIKMEDFGDAILIDLGETEILIDGGLPNSGVPEYLKNHVDGAVEAMVLTHPHPDHFGGLIEVLQKYDVNQMWLNGDIPHERKPYFRGYKFFETLVNREGASIYEARRGDTIDIDILSFKVLHPDKLFTAKIDPRSMNRNSIVMRLQYGKISFLFTGDAPKETEKEILEAGLEVQADILKVGQHGTNWCSSHKFLKSVKPKVAVYMAGEKQPERGPKKPHPSTISALKEVGAEVYGTTTHGSIIITTDGKTYTIRTQK